MRESNVNVLIIGAGPAGLAAAIQLAKLGVKDLLVLDREKEAGGAPRQICHTGFGMRDLHRVFSGPKYASLYVQKAKKAGVNIQTKSSIVNWVDTNSVLMSSPAGLETIHAQAILLATGCRERPSTARLIPGFRPHGVYTTGSLQDFVHEHNMPVGKKAVIIGSELVSYSAVHTLKKAKCKVEHIITNESKHQVYMPYLPYKWWTANIFPRIPFSANSFVARIEGKENVTGVVIGKTNSPDEEIISCDTVVFSGNWIPDHELARLAGLLLNPQTNGPLIDTQFRTFQKGIFAAGNLLRGVEPADIAALEGRRAAQSIKQYLDVNTWIGKEHKIQTNGPIEWLVPTVVPSDSNLFDNHFLFRVKEFLNNQTLTVTQGPNVLYQKTYRRLGPNYSFKLKGDWVQTVNGNDDVTVSLSP